MMIPLRLSMALALTFALGCEGDTGDQGPSGPQGPPGEPGEPGGLDPDTAPLEKAIIGVGGQQALDELESFRIEASGRTRIALEGVGAEDLPIVTSEFEATGAHDIAGDRLRIDYDRARARFNLQRTYSVIVQGQVGVIDGNEGNFGGPDGFVDMTTARWAATRKQEWLLNPQLLLRATPAEQVSDEGVDLVGDSLHHVLVVADEVSPISLFVDVRTGELSKLATVENDYLLGDTPLEVFYSGWQAGDDADGVRFPSDVLITFDGQVVHTERRTSVAVNPELGDDLFAFPAGAEPQYDQADEGRGDRNHQYHQSFAAFGFPRDVLQSSVVANELVEGVFHLTGGSHHSMIVDQADGLVLLEAPLNEARALAILDWAESEFPDKAIAHVVATHHHHDHTGALRTLVARGAVVHVGAPSQRFFERAFASTHTIEPDELARQPRAAEIRPVPVGGTVVLADGAREVLLHHIDTTHANDFVMIEVQSATERFIFQSDLYSPPPTAEDRPASQAERELYDAITGRSLTIDRFAGGHGAVVPFQNLENLVNRPAAP